MQILKENDIEEYQINIFLFHVGNDIVFAMRSYYSFIVCFVFNNASPLYNRDKLLLQL